MISVPDTYIGHTWELPNQGTQVHTQHTLGCESRKAGLSHPHSALLPGVMGLTNV